MADNPLRARALAALRRLGDALEARRDVGAVLIRLAFGYHLVQYTWEEILLARAHLGFAAWLAELGVPCPKVMAYVALGTEFFGGLCWIAGWWVRPVSVLVAFNFVAALVLVHSHHVYARRFEAVQMLAVSLFLVFSGAGWPSVDAWRRGRRQAPSPGEPRRGDGN